MQARERQRPQRFELIHPLGEQLSQRCLGSMNTKPPLEGLKFFRRKIGRIGMGVPVRLHLRFQRRLSVDDDPDRHGREHRTEGDNRAQREGEGCQHPRSWEERDQRCRWGCLQTLMLLSQKTDLSPNQR